MKMMLVKWWFLFLAISAIEGSLRVWKPKGYSTEESVTKQILETCYGDNVFEDLIFILGDFNEFINKASVIRMKNLLNVSKDYESGQYSNIGVTKVLIIEDSPEKLHSDLISFDKTRWWNYMLSFFIIGRNDEKCGNVKEILNTTWRMDIINSIYICSKSESTILYTLNPITDYAPEPWQRLEHLNDSNIYHQVFDSHTSCNNLNYDKTKVLNGYQIEAMAPPLPENWTANDLGSVLRAYHSSHLFTSIASQLNASIMYKPLMFQLGIPHVDVEYLLLLFFRNGRFLHLFPAVERDQYIVLVRSNERTVLHKIGRLWSTQVLYVAAVALIILFLILVMKNSDMTSAILDIIRFFTYVSIRTDTRSNSFRIYFITMLIFIVISNGVFQGKIAAFLTKPDKISPIKNIEEMEHLGYHLYIFHSSSSGRLLSRSYRYASFEKLVNSPDECIDYALNGTLNACIFPLSSYEGKHLLKSSDLVRLQCKAAHWHDWKTRRNWPLYTERKNAVKNNQIKVSLKKFDCFNSSKQIFGCNPRIIV